MIAAPKIGRELKCPRCGHTWLYRGIKPSTPCSQCKLKVLTGIPKPVWSKPTTNPTDYANRITQGRTEGKEGEATGRIFPPALETDVGQTADSPVSVLPEFIEMHPADWQPPPKKPDFLGQIFSLQSKLAAQRDKNVRLAIQNAELTAVAARALNEGRREVEAGLKEAAEQLATAESMQAEAGATTAELHAARTELVEWQAALEEERDALAVEKKAIEKERDEGAAEIDATVKSVEEFQRILKATYEETASNVIPLVPNVSISAQEYDFGERTRRMHKALKDAIEGVRPVALALRNKLETPKATPDEGEESQKAPPKKEPAPVTKILNPLFMEHASDDKGIKTPGGGKRPKASSAGTM